MKIPDISLASPIIKDDPSATAQMAAVIAKLEDTLRDIYSKLGTIEIVTSAPVATQLEVTGNDKGGFLSEIKILDDVTQSSRKLYYKEKAGNLRLIDSA